MTLVSEQDTRSLYERESTVSEQVGDDNTSSSINEEMSASSVGSSSPWLSARIFQNGSSIFKEYECSINYTRKNYRK